MISGFGSWYARTYKYIYIYIYILSYYLSTDKRSVRVIVFRFYFWSPSRVYVCCHEAYAERLDDARVSFACLRPSGLRFAVNESKKLKTIINVDSAKSRGRVRPYTMQIRRTFPCRSVATKARRRRTTTTRDTNYVESLTKQADSVNDRFLIDSA